MCLRGYQTIRHHITLMTSTLTKPLCLHPTITKGNLKLVISTFYSNHWVHLKAIYFKNLQLRGPPAILRKPWIKTLKKLLFPHEKAQHRRSTHGPSQCAYERHSHPGRPPFLILSGVNASHKRTGQHQWAPYISGVGTWLLKVKPVSC
jgi:hypothetical protein